MLTTRPTIACLALTLAAAADLHGACDTGNRPGATLLFPYFEVDLADHGGRTTLAAIGNASSEPVLAHGVLWTNWGLPSLTFDLYLPGHAVETLNFRDLLRGSVPVTGTARKLTPPPLLPGFSVCTDPVSNPSLGDAEIAELRAKHTGQASPIDGLCHSSPAAEPSLATGYLTVDAMNDCSPSIRVPGDDGYFAPGGTGLASHRNVLWGDFFLVDEAGNSAQGLEAVALAADAERFHGGGERDTFYRAYVGNDASDARAPLGSVVRARYLIGGVFDGGTDLLAWYESAGPDVAPAACGESPFTGFGPGHLQAVVRDLAGTRTSTPRLFPTARTLRLRLGSDLPVEPGFGTVDIQGVVFLPVPILPPPIPLQTWAASLIRAEGRFSVGQQAVRLDDLCDELAGLRRSGD